MRKYGVSLLRASIAFFVCMLTFLVIDAFVQTIVYPAISDVFPSVFPRYNPIFEKEEFLAQGRRLSLVSALISALAVGIIELRLDNMRFEFLISKTDGFYKIRDGVSIYTKEFLISDIISAAFAPAIFIPLTLIRLPEKAARISDILDNFILAMPKAIIGEIGEIGTYFILFTVLVFARIIGAYSGLYRWRALWLSDTGGE